MFSFVPFPGDNQRQMSHCATLILVDISPFYCCANNRASREEKKKGGGGGEETIDGRGQIKKRSGDPHTHTHKQELNKLVEGGLYEILLSTG